jgi:outer membrane protein TolC
MKKGFLLLIVPLLFLSRAAGQSTVEGSHEKPQPPTAYTLEDLREAAKKHFPEFKQFAIMDQSYELEMEKLKTMIYPKLNFGLQASWQSAVTAIPVSLPGIEIKTQPRDQYKAYVDANQVLYDGGLMKKTLDVKAQNKNIETNKLNVSIYRLQEQVDFLFFSTLLLQAQRKQLTLAKTTIENKLNQVKGAIDNGVMLESNAWLLEAELVKNTQQTLELNSQEASIRRMINEWTGLEMTDDKELVRPENREVSMLVATAYNRPEETLFDAQKEGLNAGIRAVDAKYRPKVFAFTQAGYGRPGLNFLDTRFRPWVIVGAKLTWEIHDWGAGKLEKESMALQKQLVQIQHDAFKRQSKLGIIQAEEDLGKLAKLMVQDERLIALRTKIRETSSTQLDNGVITATEYLDRVNEETAANLSRELHEIQILMTKYRYGYITGQF